MANVSQLPCTKSRPECRTGAIALLLASYFLTASLSFGQSFFPLSDVRAGLKGTGRTVFQDNRIEEFQVEILGVLENLTPKQSIILARLSGGPLAETGVMQGMSGSPVYVDGKLLGAIALGFPFSKQPIAGIQPIGQMIADVDSLQRHDDAGLRPSSPAFQRAVLASRLDPAGRALSSSFGDLKEIFTPLAMAGFSNSTVQAFTAKFHQLGLEPQMGVGGGIRISQSQIETGKLGSVLPGSMISVQLLAGDMTISADGTVTYVDGKRVYAFGHRFLDSGSTDLPFARADVVALLPTINSSFKLSAAREWVGSITSDRSTAIAGEIGRPARLVPLTIRVQTAAAAPHEYHLQVVNDRLLTPFITQAALYSTIDATERTLGTGTLRLRGRVEFEGSTPPVLVNDVFVSDTSVAQQATADAVATLGFVLGSSFRDLRVKSLSYEMAPMERKRQLRIAQVWASRHDVRPGETIELTALLQGDDGLEMTRTAKYTVPVGAPPGLLNFTISDAITMNAPDFAGMNQSSFRSAADLVGALNKFRASDAAYVRVWRQEPAFNVTGPSPSAELSDPPPSVTLILADPSASASGSAALSAARGSALAELRMPVDQYQVTGAKTIQVEIKD